VTNGTADALLLETFGPQLLAYLCNVGEQQVDERFRDGTSLPGPSEAALAQLIPLAERVAQQRLHQPGYPFSLSLSVLGSVPAGADTSIGNLIRLSAGGEVEEPEVVGSGDEVAAHLHRLARDAYPQLLVPSEEWWGQPMHLSFFHHPARADLQRAVHEDPQLSRMYPSEDGDLGRRGYVVNSLGRGGTVHSVMFAESVLRAAWDLASMATAIPSLGSLYGALEESVDLLRRALAGEPTETRALFAFTGLTTGGRTVGTPWGVLRPITEAERGVSPPSLDGAVSGTDAEGRSVTVSYAGEVVLDTRIPFGLSAHGCEPGEEPPDFPSSTQLNGARAMRRRREGMQLAVLLAVDRPAGQWATARFAWHWIADPTSHGRSMGWADPRTAPGFMPTELSEDECDALRRWCDVVEARWSPHVDIAVRRLLSAAQVRNDASDRLVDSVIAWENLFGTSEGEPRLRISSAMAWLLTETVTERTDLQKEIKQLYDDRSKIVHGGTFDESAVTEKANRALELARSCLQALFRDRPAILSMSDGSARSLALILNSHD
jgi:hypothetical protein